MACGGNCGCHVCRGQGQEVARPLFGGGAAVPVFGGSPPRRRRSGVRNRIDQKVDPMFGRAGAVPWAPNRWALRPGERVTLLFGARKAAPVVARPPGPEGGGAGRGDDAAQEGLERYVQLLGYYIFGVMPPQSRATSYMLLCRRLFYF
jgi:hypothetical protein